jgi:hypothetical protein
MRSHSCSSAGAHGSSRVARIVRSIRAARLDRQARLGRLRLASIAAFTVLALLACAPTAFAQMRLGLSDYEPATFSDPRVEELGIHLARDVVPWNVALKADGRERVTAWLNAVKHAYHIIPLITFQHADDSGRAPTPGQFLSAFLKFRKLFPWVKEFVPWDEANHTTQPTARNPTLAARYYNVLAAHCPGCEITAPDLLDSDANFERWTQSFLRRAHPYPKIWTFNPYSSASVDSPRLIEQFLALTKKGQVWFSEVGGVVWWRHQGHLIYHGSSYAARVARNIFKLAALSKRITRVYYYHWRTPGLPGQVSKKVTWDAGLVDVHGAVRPALRVLASELHRHIQKLIPKTF